MVEDLSSLQVFDLKGSLRNRHVKTDLVKESCEVVLLDENLLKLIHDNPLYIRSHCKSILRAAIHSDAYFLSSHLIIDYSLLVGWDDATDQLVVGIIGQVQRLRIQLPLLGMLSWSLWSDLCPLLCRLYQDVHLGQEVRDGGQIHWNPGGSGWVWLLQFTLTTASKKIRAVREEDLN